MDAKSNKDDDDDTGYDLFNFLTNLLQKDKKFSVTGILFIIAIVFLGLLLVNQDFRDTLWGVFQNATILAFILGILFIACFLVIGVYEIYTRGKVEAEKKKLEIEKNRLEVEKERLETKNKDLETENSELKVENKKLATKNRDLERESLKKEYENKLEVLKQKNNLLLQQIEKNDTVNEAPSITGDIVGAHKDNNCHGFTHQILNSEKDLNLSDQVVDLGKQVK